MAENMSTLPALSYDSISDILNQKIFNSVILQVMGYKKVPANGSGPARYRMCLNDGKTLFSFAMLSTQLNNLIESKHLEKFSIIKLNRYACTEIHTKKIIICTEIDPLVSGEMVGKQVLLGEQNCTQINTTSSFNTSFETQQDVDMSNSHNVDSSNQNGNKLLDKNVSQQPSSSNDGNKFIAPKSNDKLADCNRTLEGSSVVHANSMSLSRNNISSPIKSCSANATSGTTPVPVKANHTHIIPIINLTPYQNKWVIKGRVTYKTPLVHYNNQRSAGKLFSFYLLDETGEIRAIAFQEQAEHLSTFLEVGQVYYVSNANVKLARGDSPLKCDFEIAVTENTLIEVSSDEINIPTMEFNFVPLNEIESLPKDTFVDIIGACYNSSYVQTIVSKANAREVTKRDLFLIDQSKTIMLVALWGSDAEKLEIDQVDSVIAIRNSKVTDFKGCSLSVTQGSMLFINPNIQQAHSLKLWFKTEGSAFKGKSPELGLNQIWNTIADMRSFELENSDQAKYFTVKACVTMVQKEKCMYQSCPDSDCQKKVQDMGNGLYHCSKCNQDYNTFTWTMLLSLDIADFSGSIWVTAFRDVAETILDMKSDELSKLKELNIDEYYTVLTNVQFKSFVFKLRSKIEVYNDTKQLKTIILDAKLIEPIAHSKKLLFDINHLDKILNHQVS